MHNKRPEKSLEQEIMKTDLTELELIEKNNIFGDKGPTSR